MKHLKPFISLGMLLICLTLLIVPAFADGPSDDDVNNVARKLFCPVCENIPLDVCGTQACAQWRDEIRAQLAAGKTPQQVIDDFVGRFGDRVVGTPQDPTLRALSLVTPWAISALAVFGAVVLFARWRKAQRTGPIDSSPALVGNAVQAPSKPLDEYRARIERDLKRRQ